MPFFQWVLNELMCVLKSACIELELTLPCVWYFLFLAPFREIRRQPNYHRHLAPHVHWTSHPLFFLLGAPNNLQNWVKTIENTPAMVKFMCPFGWATGCPDTWSNIILGISGRVLLDEIIFKISELRVKQTALHNVDGSIQSHECLTRTKNLPPPPPPKQERILQQTAFELHL